MIIFHEGLIAEIVSEALLISIDWKDLRENRHLFPFLHEDDP